MKINIHEITDRYKKYAVILAYENNQIILVRHKNRLTWEIPGGHNEPNEPILSTAKRELFEETGAVRFDIKHLFDYSVDKGNEISYGGLFIANIYDRELQLNHEIVEVKPYTELPSFENLTYGKIQGELFKLVNESSKETISEFLQQN